MRPKQAMPDKAVIVFTQPGGLFCDKLKEFLSQQGVEYTERDVTKDEDALHELEKMKVFSTPVTVVGGEVVIGLDKAKLEKLLQNLRVAIGTVSVCPK